MPPRDSSSEPLVQLPPRAAQSHKGHYGRVLVVAGSRDMAGAAGLVGLAALRSGAGLVTVATTRSAQPTVARYSPCYTTRAVEEADDGTMLQSNAPLLEQLGEPFDVWAIGPGLGQSEGVRQLVVLLYRSVTAPMVVDADALNALASVAATQSDTLANPPGPRILTPHGGEFERLSGVRAATDGTSRPHQASQLCGRDPSGQTIVVMKGHPSIVCETRRYAQSFTGNPGMATGGSGDCLTGVIAGLLAQPVDPWDATRLGVYVHGLAGDLGVRTLGETSLIATDIIDHLGAAFQQVSP